MHHEKSAYETSLAAKDATGRANDLSMAEFEHRIVEVRVANLIKLYPQDSELKSILDARCDEFARDISKIYSVVENSIEESFEHYKGGEGVYQSVQTTFANVETGIKDFEISLDNYKKKRDALALSGELADEPEKMKNKIIDLDSDLDNSINEIMAGVVKSKNVLYAQIYNVLHPPELGASQV